MPDDEAAAWIGWGSGVARGPSEHGVCEAESLPVLHDGFGLDAEARIFRRCQLAEEILWQRWRATATAEEREIGDELVRTWQLDRRQLILLLPSLVAGP
jgi:hypothetical protein